MTLNILTTEPNKKKSRKTAKVALKIKALVEIPVAFNCSQASSNIQLLFKNYDKAYAIWTPRSLYVRVILNCHNGPHKIEVQGTTWNTFVVK